MIRRVLLALAAFALPLCFSPRPAAAQASPAAAAPESCIPNYARISRMQGLLHWNHFPLRVAIAAPPASLPDKAAYLRAVLAGFTQWTDASRGAVRYALTLDPRQADVTVSFTSQATVPGQGAAVGYTSMVFQGTVLRGADMQLATGGATPDDLQAVAAHEFGHALGIDGHSDDASDIMYPSTLRMTSEDGLPLASPPHPVTARDFNTLKVCYPDLFRLHLAARPPASPFPGRLGAALLGTRHPASRALCVPCRPVHH